MKMENFWGTKNWRIFLEGLKQKVGIFIKVNNIFNPKKYIDINFLFFL